jgi:hypothetical protein
MGLPKIDLPLFELVQPSTGKKVKYRPFTVKEEKILLTAQESKDIDQIILAIKQIIGNCFTGVNPETLPMFDLEYMLINIRAKSVDNVIRFSITDPDTKEKIDLKLDVNEITVKQKEGHTNKIKLNDEFILIMRYLTVNELREIANKSSEMTQLKLFNIFIKCIDSLVSTTSDEVYKFADFTEQEVNDFIESLDTTATNKIKTFFDTAPVLRFEVPYKTSDGTQKTFVMEGVESFFI